MADSIVLRISGNSQELVRAIAAARTSLQQFNVEVGRTGSPATTRNVDALAAAFNRTAAGATSLQERLSKTGAATTSVGTALLPVTASIVAFGAGAISAASSFRTAFAGVEKTFDTTGKSADDVSATLDRFRDGIRQMTTEVPRTAEELASMATQAQQLGVSSENLLSFTKQAAQLADAVEGISPEGAIEGLAKLRNITRDSEKDFGRMASAMTVVATRSAATNATILDFASRIAGAGKEIGLTTPEILGLSGTLSSVGLNAEAGGSAISRFFNQMQSAVEQGGEKLEAFANVTGRTTEEFATLFRTKPIAAVQAFLEGLQRTKDEGGALSIVLKDIGAEAIREVDTLRRSTVAMGDLTKQIANANEGWQSQNEFVRQSQIVQRTFGAQMRMLGEQFREIGRLIGDELIDQLSSMSGGVHAVMGTLTELAKAFVALPGPIKLAVEAGLGIAAITPVVLILVGQLANAAANILRMRDAWVALSAARAAETFIETAGAAAQAEKSIAAVAGTVAQVSSSMFSVSNSAVLMSAEIVKSGKATTTSFAQTEAAFANLAGRFRNTTSITDVFTAIKTAATGAVGTITEGFGTLVSRAGPLLGTIGIIGGIVLALRELTGSWETTFDIMLPPLWAAKKAWADLQEQIKQNKPAIDGTKDSFLGFMRGMKEVDDALGDAIKFVKNFGATAIENANIFRTEVPKGVQAGADGAKGITEQAIADQKSQWQGYWDWFRAQAKKLKDAAEATVPGDVDVPAVQGPKPQNVFGKPLVPAQSIKDAEALAEQMKKTADAVRKYDEQVGESIRLNALYEQDMRAKGLPVFRDAAEAVKRYGVQVDAAAAKHGIAESSLNRFIKGMGESAKAAKAASHGPLQEFKKKLDDLDVSLAAANANLTDQEIAEQYGDQLDKMAVLAKQFGISVSADFKKAAEAANRFNVKDAAEIIHKEVGAINETTDKLWQDAEDKRVEHVRDMSKQVIATERELAAQKQGIFQTELEREIASIKAWGDDIKREAHGVVENFDEFATAIDRQVNDKIVLATMNSNEFGRAAASVFAAVPMAMAPTALFLDKIVDKTDKAENKTKTWSETLDETARAFAQLAQIAGGSLGKVLSGIGQVIAASDTMKKGIDGFRSGLKALGEWKKNKDSGIGGMISGIGQLVTGILGAVSAGIALGKALFDAFHKPEWKRIQAGIGRDFGKTVTDGLAQQIEEYTKQFGGSRTAGTIFGLDKIMDEVVLNSRNLDLFTGKLRDTFSMLEQGTFTTEQAADVLDRTFPKIAQHILDSGELFSDKFREIIALNARMGTESKQIADFVATQTARAGASLGTIFAPLKKQTDEIIDKMDEADKAARDLMNEDSLSGSEQKKLDEWNRKWDESRDKLLEFQDDVQRAGVLISKTFSDSIASGMSYGDALQAVLPALDDIIPAYEKLKALGIDFNNTLLDQIISDAKLTESHRDLVDAMGAANSYLQAASALGKINQEQWDALATTINENAKQMEAAGFSQTAVLQSMLPFLRQAIELQETQGIKIDATTQKYIDQAKEAGLSLEKQKTEAEILTEGFEGLNAGMAALIETLGGKVPAALQKVVDAANDAAGGIGGVNDNLDDMTDKFARIRDRGTSALDDISEKAREAQRAVDGVSFGHSPGGLKEWVPMLVRSSEAMKQFRSNAGDALLAVDAKLKELSDVTIAPTISDAQIDDMRKQVEVYIKNTDYAKREPTPIENAERETTPRDQPSTWRDRPPTWREQPLSTRPDTEQIVRVISDTIKALPPEDITASIDPIAIEKLRKEMEGYFKHQTPDREVLPEKGERDTSPRDSFTDLFKGEQWQKFIERIPTMKVDPGFDIDRDPLKLDQWQKLLAERDDKRDDREEQFLDELLKRLPEFPHTTTFDPDVIEDVIRRTSDTISFNSDVVRASGDREQAVANVLENRLADIVSELRESPRMTVEVHEGAFKQELVERTVDTTRELAKRIAPDVLDTVRSGGDRYGQLSSVITGILRDKGVL